MKRRQLKSELQKPAYSVYLDRLDRLSRAANEEEREAVYRQLASILNAPAAPRKARRSSLSVADLATAIDAAELAALSPAKANQLASVVAMADKAKAADTVRLASAVFGPGATSTALAADVDEPQTLAESLGIAKGEVRYWHVGRALLDIASDEDEGE